MIVMDEMGNTFIHPKRRDILHHSSFFSGNAVAFAGLIMVKDGIIHNLLIYSGHYSPGCNELYNFQNEADRNRISIESLEELIISRQITKTIFDLKSIIQKQTSLFAYIEGSSIIFNGKSISN